MRAASSLPQQITRRATRLLEKVRPRHSCFELTRCAARCLLIVAGRGVVVAAYEVEGGGRPEDESLMHPRRRCLTSMNHHRSP